MSCITTLSLFFLSITFSTLLLNFTIILHLFVQTKSSMFIINNCVLVTINCFVKTRQINYSLLIYCIGVPILNLYCYQNALLILTECVIHAFVSVSIIYIHYLTKKINLVSYKMNDEYFLLYHRLENSKKKVTMYGYKLFLISSVIDIIIYFLCSNMYYLLLKCMFKSLIVYHYYQHYLIQASAKQKKLF